MTSQSGNDEAVTPPELDQSGTERIVSPTLEPSGMAWALPTATLLVSLILGLVLWQCDDRSAQAVAPTAERGLIVYREAGCGACHGQTALGGSGPALGGHRVDQVLRQVRAPLGAMPMFTQSELSDNDLGAIAKFVVDLEPVDHTIRWGTAEGNELDPRDALSTHHWLALTAIRNGDIAETAHQIEHINGLITGEHLEAMRNITDLLDRGETTGAELRLANMSAGNVPKPALLDKLNLGLAAQALGASDSNEASRHTLGG